MRLKVSIETDIELLHITGKQMVLQDNIILLRSMTSFRKNMQQFAKSMNL